MNSNQIFEALEAINQHKGNTKIEAITSFAANPAFVLAVKQALDPHTTYGVNKVETPDTYGDRPFASSTQALLDHLAKRTWTGHKARDMIAAEMAHLHPNSQQLLVRILKKDLRCGAGASTFNKVVKGWVPVFSCQLAQPYEFKRVKGSVMVEPKYDGMRALAMVGVAAREVRFLSRNGLDIPALNGYASTFLAAGLHAQDHVVDFEYVDGGFNDTISAARKKYEQAEGGVCMVFAFLPMSEFLEGQSQLTHAQMREQLVQVTDRMPSAVRGTLFITESEVLDDEAAIQGAYDRHLAAGLEGAMIKHPQHPYTTRRSYSWMKMKPTETADVIVTGAYYGDKGKQFEHTLGGLLVDYGGVEVRVGTGWAAKPGKPNSRDTILAGVKRDILKAGASSNRFRSDGTREIRLTEEQILGLETQQPEALSRMIECKYHVVTIDGSLRHPRFEKFRDSRDAPGFKK